jgi:hypothetical protein
MTDPKTPEEPETAPIVENGDVGESGVPEGEEPAPDPADE